MELYNSDDIVALATPPGSGALAIVRFSGLNLHSLYKKLSHKKTKNRTAVFTKIYHPNKNIILDHAVITFFQAPKSFTGEDVIEITCHGGKIIYQSIIDAAVDCGIRMAGPGEFSFRAFLNKKIDLVQAESIASLIESNSKMAANHSLAHLDGRVSKIFIQIKKTSIDMLSIIENELNFSEEEINFTSIKDIKNDLYDIRNRLKEILLSSTFGEGFGGECRVVILGRSNAGKSSLFNAIIGHDRAIVSSRAGTTRDTVESCIEINGVVICLVDTAGFWESDDYIDQISIKKSALEVGRSDLCLVLDEKNPKKLIQSNFLKNIDNPYILIQSKCDDGLARKQPTPSNDFLRVSAKSGHGIKELLTMISTTLMDSVDKSPGMLASITRRQRALIQRALITIDSAIKECGSAPRTDILASILQNFIATMKDVLGEISSKEVLHNIFTSFCIGK